MKVPTKLLGILAVIIIMATAMGCDSGNGGNHQKLQKMTLWIIPHYEQTLKIKL